MNLIEHYIKEVLSVKDITEEYKEIIKVYYEDIVIDEPVYEVKMKINCYGREETVIVVWDKSEYEGNINRGYYMG